jgi:hypothetical protein
MNQELDQASRIPTYAVGTHALATRDALKRAMLLFESIQFTRWARLPGDEQKRPVICASQFGEDWSPDRLNSVLRYEYEGDPVESRQIEISFALGLIKNLKGRVLVCGDQKDFASQSRTGDQIAFQAALGSIPEIIEERASWEQILEIRRDPDACRKCRDLRLWLTYSLEARSLQQAQDIIEKKIEDYSWALRKHGLETTTGTLSSILNWKGLTAIAGGSAIAALGTSPLLSTLAAGSVVLGNAAVWIAKRRIALEDLKRGPNSEIALIHDFQEKWGQ